MRVTVCAYTKVFSCVCLCDCNLFNKSADFASFWLSDIREFVNVTEHGVTAVLCKVKRFTSLRVIMFACDGD